MALDQACSAVTSKGEFVLKDKNSWQGAKF